MPRGTIEPFCGLLRMGRLLGTALPDMLPRSLGVFAFPMALAC